MAKWKAPTIQASLVKGSWVIRRRSSPLAQDRTTPGPRSHAPSLSKRLPSTPRPNASECAAPLGKLPSVGTTSGHEAKDLTDHKDLTLVHQTVVVNGCMETCATSTPFDPQAGRADMLPQTPQAQERMTALHLQHLRSKCPSNNDSRLLSATHTWDLAPIITCDSRRSQPHLQRHKWIAADGSTAQWEVMPLFPARLPTTSTLNRCALPLGLAIMNTTRASIALRRDLCIRSRWKSDCNEDAECCEP